LETTSLPSGLGHPGHYPRVEPRSPAFGKTGRRRARSIFGASCVMKTHSPSELTRSAPRSYGWATRFRNGRSDLHGILGLAFSNGPLIFSAAFASNSSAWLAAYRLSSPSGAKNRAFPLSTITAITRRWFRISSAGSRSLSWDPVTARPSPLRFGVRSPSEPRLRSANALRLEKSLVNTFVQRGGPSRKVLAQ
jgi:hypothetical protein